MVDGLLAIPTPFSQFEFSIRYVAPFTFSIRDNETGTITALNITHSFGVAVYDMEVFLYALEC